MVLLVLQALSISPTLASVAPQITYSRFYRQNTTNIYAVYCIANADKGYHMSWSAVGADGSTIWSDQRNYPALNTCQGNVWFFANVVGGEHLVVTITGHGSGGSTTARFDLYPATGGLLNQCSIQSDTNSPLVRDPRYREDTAQGIACAFVDPAVVQPPTPQPTPTPQPGTRISNERFLWDGGFAGGSILADRCINAQYHWLTSEEVWSHAGSNPRRLGSWPYGALNGCVTHYPAIGVQVGDTIEIGIGASDTPPPADLFTAVGTKFYRVTRTSTGVTWQFSREITSPPQTMPTPTPTTLDCGQLRYSKVADGICISNANNMHIAVADLGNANVQIELAYEFADQKRAVFHQKLLETFVQKRSGAGDGRDIRHYYAAINGTAMQQESIFPCLFSALCTSGSDASILGIGGTTYGKTGSGSGSDGAQYIDVFPATGKYSSFFAYRSGDRSGSIFRSKQPPEILRDEDFMNNDNGSAAKFIQEKITASTFAVGYSAAILDGEYTKRESGATYPKTAIGISQDHKRVFIATARKGVTTEDFVAQLKAAGAYRAILLDSGGSSQFSGYAEENHKPYRWNAGEGTGLRRKVINGIVVYNNSKVASQVSRIAATGGTYALAESTTATFDPGTFNDLSFVTYTPQFPDSVEGYAHVNQFYDLHAIGTVNTSAQGNDAAVQSVSMAKANQPYAVSVQYQQMDVPSGVSEEELALYFWNGTAWEREPTSAVDPTTNTVSAATPRFGEWAILAPYPERVYLPTVYNMN